VGRQVTGGSLKESREALEIAETDGKLSGLPACCGSWTSAVLGGACKVFGEMHLRSCLVCVQCREAVLHCGRAPDEMRGSWNFSIGICYCCLVVLLFPDPVHFGCLGVRGEWRPRGSFSGTAGSSEGGDRERQGCVWLYCFPAGKKWCDYCFLVS